MSGPGAVAERSSEEAAHFRFLANELVSFLAILVRTSYFHEPRNRAFELPVERFQALAAELLDPEGRLRIERCGPDLFVNARRLRPQFKNVRVFAEVQRVLDAHGLGGLEWQAVPSRAALAT